MEGEFVVQEELAEKKKRQKKVRISADGTPYTVWQTRTRILCLIYLVWALLEIAVGAGFLTIRSIGLFDPTELVPNITFGGSTVLSGVFNLIIALSGLWGAYNPRRDYAVLLVSISYGAAVGMAGGQCMVDGAGRPRHGLFSRCGACLRGLRLERAWPNGLLRQSPETRRRRAAHPARSAFTPESGKGKRIGACCRQRRA